MDALIFIHIYFMCFLFSPNYFPSWKPSVINCCHLDKIRYSLHKCQWPPALFYLIMNAIFNLKILPCMLLIMKFRFKVSTHEPSSQLSVSPPCWSHSSLELIPYKLVSAKWQRWSHLFRLCHCSAALVEIQAPSSRLKKHKHQFAAQHGNILESYGKK